MPNGRKCGQHREVFSKKCYTFVGGRNRIQNKEKLVWQRIG